MNHRRGAKQHGFEAALIGGPAFASLPLNWFFPVPPLGGLDPVVPVDPEWPTVTLRDLISDAELGDLDDDVAESVVAPRSPEGAEAEEDGGVKPENGGEWLISIVRNASGEVEHQHGLHSGSLNPPPYFPTKMCSELCGVAGEGEEDEEERNPKADPTARLQVSHLYLELGRRLAQRKMR
jgi:hypothetical protein